HLLHLAGHAVGRVEQAGHHSPINVIAVPEILRGVAADDLRDGAARPAAPGPTSRTVPPSRPPDLSSTWESLGTLYSPSSSSRISTFSLAILNRCTRPMLTPRICTGSPRRMPPASVTTVLTM